MFNSMNIPRKLGLSFVAINITAAIMMLVFGINIAMIANTTEQNNFNSAVHTDAIALETAILRQNSQLRGYLVTGDQSYLKSYYEGRDEYDRTSADLEKRLSDPAERALVVKSREATLAWRKNWGDKYVAVVKAGGREQAQEAIRAAGKAVLVSDAVLPLRDLRDNQQAQLTANSERQSMAITAAWVALAIGAILLIGLAASLARALSRSIAEPITALTRAMTELASGHHDVSVPETDRGDELGDMARAVLVFRDAAQERVVAVAEREAAMREVGARLHDVAKADLSVRLSGLPEAFEGLASDFNEALANLCGAMGTVQGSIESINTNSTEIRQATAELSHRSEQQAANLQASVHAMSEITRKVGESATIASDANRAMTEARGEAEQGGAVVSKAIEAMQGVEKASGEIAEIIAVIDGIAFQTNLLALNAGVEAARAGEAGKGFAVVASEVRALAQRAAEAASDVKSRIHSATEHVRSGVELVNETGSALKRIIGRVGSVSQAIEAIADAASQQSEGLTQVNAAINSMDVMTQQNAAMVEETTAATQALAKEAEQLSEAFASFRIGQPQTRRDSWLRPAEPLRFTARAAPRRPAPPPVSAAPVTGPATTHSSGNLALKDDDWSEF